MRILLVEDDIKIRRFIKAGLEAELFIVDATDNGEKGLSLASSNDYDLIILDNMLPGKNGLEICKELRRQGKITPILMLSVKADTNTKIELLNSGADDYLSKPFSFEELVARVRALLRRPKQLNDEVLTIEDLVVDFKKNNARRGQKEIHLTQKEFALLEYLVRNRGVVLSRGMILEHVWDMEVDPFTNTIESHVSNLRKKIDAEGTRRLIHTVVGRGYKINA
ncbi:MAG: Two component transcriptional regulator, winged helix family [Parcubacteria group bacterium GW2011_GWB1_40_14]|nr:MAG: Two component transcriptional regulator, winged helix family [Parcubacteria group bacterium GW2011_GWB1_40_14]